MREVKPITFFEQFNDYNEINKYISDNPDKRVKNWQVVKSCTGDIVIMVEFEAVNKIINE